MQTHFTSATEFADVMASLETNTADTPYTIRLNVDNIGSSLNSGSIGNIIRSNQKFVNLDLSGSNLTSIRQDAFAYSVELTGITIPASVETIGDSAFAEATELSSVIFADGSQLETIDARAFQFTAITSITIPASVTEIAVRAFSYNKNLTAITVHENNTNFSSQDGILYDRNQTTLIFAPEGLSGTVTIPASVKTINGSSFSNCTSLNLTSVTFEQDSQLTTIGMYAFQGTTAIDIIEIPASVTEMVTFSELVPMPISHIFSGWTSSQTIIILGHPDQESADEAWGGPYWRAGCNADIQYTGQ